MKKYIGRRLLQLIPIVIGLTFFVYLLMFISGGDPATKKLLAQGIEVEESVLEAAREEMGLNRPFIVQYADWFFHACRGDLGVSYRDGFSVAGKLLDAGRNTLLLASASLLIALLIAVPLGIITAVFRNGIIDTIVRVISFFGISIPNFLLSVLLMYFFCVRIKVFPVIAKESINGLFLPSLALALPMMSRFTRQIRAQILEELEKPYVSGALSRGISLNSVLYKDVLHNALIPIVTIVGLSIGTLMGGSVVTETVFRWPGLGKLVMDAIKARDYPVVQGFTLLMGIVYVLVNLITDISYHKLDPRIREM